MNKHLVKEWPISHEKMPNSLAVGQMKSKIQRNFTKSWSNGQNDRMADRMWGNRNSYALLVGV